MRLATSRRARTAEDERMLIYYSNDYHFFLPSYDEAMRARPTEPPPFEEAVNSQNDNQSAQNEEGMIITVFDPQPVQASLCSSLGKCVPCCTCRSITWLDHGVHSSL